MKTGIGGRTADGERDDVGACVEEEELVVC